MEKVKIRAKLKHRITEVEFYKSTFHASKEYVNQHITHDFPLMKSKYADGILCDDGFLEVNVLGFKLDGEPSNRYYCYDKADTKIWDIEVVEGK